MPISFDRLIDQKAFDWLKAYSVDTLFTEELVSNDRQPDLYGAAVFTAQKSKASMPLIRSLKRRYKRAVVKIQRAKPAFMQTPNVIQQ